MDSGTGTRLVSGASYMELELQSAGGGALLVTTADKLGDPSMNGRMAWVRR